MNKTTLENKGYPAKSADFVGRGGATERADFWPEWPEVASAVCADEARRYQRVWGHPNKHFRGAKIASVYTLALLAVSA